MRYTNMAQGSGYNATWRGMAWGIANQFSEWNSNMDYMYWRGDYVMSGFGGTTGYFSYFGTLLGSGSTGGDILGMDVLTNAGMSFIQNILVNVLNGTMIFLKENSFSSDISSSDLQRIYINSFLELRKKFDNQEIPDFNNMSASEIGEYLFQNLFLEPNENLLATYPEFTMVNAIANYLSIRQFLPTEDAIISFGFQEPRPEVYPFFSYVGTQYGKYITIFTNNGSFGFQVQWVVIPLYSFIW